MASRDQAPVCLFLAALTAAVLAFTSACVAKPRQYSLKGQVMDISMTGELIVKHDDIPGFMPAMTMPYKPRDPGVSQQVRPGDLIAANLMVAKNGNYWLEDVRITDQSGRTAARSAVVTHTLRVGERAPDLPLINQDGKTIHLSDFRGKALLITFIYTRCPMPAFCPRLSSQFAKIHEHLAKTPADCDKTHLLTISFDPKYDTAPVLRRYGLAYLDNDASGFSHWDFASTNAADLRKLAEAFGLTYIEEDNQISHSMDIVLLTPDGLVAQYWATAWTATELEEALRQEARSASVATAKAAGMKR